MVNSSSCDSVSSALRLWGSLRGCGTTKNPIELAFSGTTSHREQIKEPVWLADLMVFNPLAGLG